MRKYEVETYKNKAYELSVKLGQLFVVSVCVVAVSMVAGGFGAYLVTSKYAPQPIHVVEETHVTELKQERTEADTKLQKAIADRDKLIKNLQDQVRVLTSKVSRVDDQVEAIRHDPVVTYSDHELEHKMKSMNLNGKVVIR